MGKEGECNDERVGFNKLFKIMSGFLLIDKEKGVTSFDVVARVRRITGEKRVGHAGTLDPLATGLLIVGVGRDATKQLGNYLKMDKEYEVTAEFGAVSDTYDAEGRIIFSAEKNDSDSNKGSSSSTIKQEDIARIIKKKFLGHIQQIPPKYSALKIKGKRACDRMREGENIELEPREVTIDEFLIMDFSWPRVKFRVKCGSGTYVRSLIHDLGQELGCGAYVEELRRTKIGKYSVDGAVKLEKLKN